MHMESREVQSDSAVHATRMPFSEVWNFTSASSAPTTCSWTTMVFYDFVKVLFHVAYFNTVCQRL